MLRTPGTLNSGARAGPSFPFSVPLARGDGAPGGAGEPCDWLPQVSFAISRPTRQASGTQGFEGGGGPGARGPLRGARRLPALQRDAIVGHRTLLPLPDAAIDDVLDRARRKRTYT